MVETKATGWGFMAGRQLKDSPGSIQINTPQVVASCRHSPCTAFLLVLIQEPGEGIRSGMKDASIYHRLTRSTKLTRSATPSVRSMAGASTFVLTMLLVTLGLLGGVQPVAAQSSASDAERIARLEQRLLELEQRLENTEQETKEVKVLAANSGAAAGGSNASILGNAATLDILAGSAWRNLRWTQASQWENIRRGVREETVIELLGYPPRSLDSMKPRVDKVFWYETSIRDSSGLRGKVSFRDGRVISYERPNFDRALDVNSRRPGTTGNARRLP
jgi:hypothetical protein